MTIKTAAEQVAEALDRIESDVYMGGPILPSVRSARAALERWRAEQDNSAAELHSVRQQRDALVIAAKAMIADLDMRARMHGDVEDGIAVLDVSSSVLELTYSAIEAASQGGEA